MRRILFPLLGLAAFGFAVFWLLTIPAAEPEGSFAGAPDPDLARGEWVFHAGGCASCHMNSDDPGGALSGGMALASDFGTFYAPNISPSVAGIAGWSARDLYNAMHHGTSPDGTHYYPAFPYTTYINTTPEDIVSLHAYLMTLPASDSPSKPHDVGFPFNQRRLLGGWKLLFLREDWSVTGNLSEQETRGRYIAEGLSHCAECHTPRGALGQLKRDDWLAGGPNPEGGTYPDITPSGLDWSPEDIAYYLTSGFTPDFDSAGGHMAYVIDNLAQLPPEDVADLVAYLKAVPPSQSE
ncbi:Nicotinate dehydrogenase subunit B [Aquimixticola soesokkakensis]|uniref:Nicotinate dehydrogenase subunit B n=1 Tax=Aquimixticola soesokkakensis TaxID=1519096 RepID=A0A1Y5SJT6_9RHOB|nr:cytochrome c [Aquimixticola soesokkakensis]SLN41792.1 Nicotinate dehydrogenase subunit B [Aquimixticola soesokkakensis]